MTVSKLFFRLFSFAFICALLSVVGFFFLYIQFTSPGPLEFKRHVVIPKGLSVKQISKYLEKEQIIHNHLILQAGVLFTQNSTKLRAGEFEFTPKMSTKDVMNALIDAPFVKRKLTIIEGSTIKQIIEQLNQTEGLVGTIELTKEMEGFLFPDTYYFHYGDPKQKIIQAMRKKMQSKIDELWEKRSEKLPLESKKSALILASIIEKETGYHNEKPRIASVFYNRIRKGMRLQSDPTTIYGLSDGYGTLDRDITRKDYKHVSDYNTYVIDGLPPTAISNPGLESIKAVFFPVKSNDLFFVADGKGAHHFAPTLDEHNKNIRLYRKVRDEKAQQAETEENHEN